MQRRGARIKTLRGNCSVCNRLGWCFMFILIFGTNRLQTLQCFCEHTTAETVAAWSEQPALQDGFPPRAATLVSSSKKPTVPLVSRTIVRSSCKNTSDFVWPMSLKTSHIAVFFDGRFKNTVSSSALGHGKLKNIAICSGFCLTEHSTEFCFRQRQRQKPRYF